MDTMRSLAAWGFFAGLLTGCFQISAQQSGSHGASPPSKFGLNSSSSGGATATTPNPPPATKVLDCERGSFPNGASRVVVKYPSAESGWDTVCRPQTVEESCIDGEVRSLLRVQTTIAGRASVFYGRPLESSCTVRALPGLRRLDWPKKYPFRTQAVQVYGTAAKTVQAQTRIYFIATNGYVPISVVDSVARRRVVLRWQDDRLLVPLFALQGEQPVYSLYEFNPVTRVLREVGLVNVPDLVYISPLNLNLRTHEGELYFFANTQSTTQAVPDVIKLNFASDGGRVDFSPAPAAEAQAVRTELAAEVKAYRDRQFACENHGICREQVSVEFGGGERLQCVSATDQEALAGVCRATFYRPSSGAVASFVADGVAGPRFPRTAVLVGDRLYFTSEMVDLDHVLLEWQL